MGELQKRRELYSDYKGSILYDKAGKKLFIFLGDKYEFEGHFHMNFISV